MHRVLPSPSRSRRITLGLIVAVAVLAADQASKAWARSSLPRGKFVPVLDHWFGFGLISNSGAAFSSLSGRNGLLAVLSTALLALVAVLLLWGALPGRSGAVALGAILGGGVGNLVDRLRVQSVDDFVVLRPWPSDFNLADASIRLGALLLIASVVLTEVRRRRA
ncbi:MAG TPA: signal peptidase II [Candidatus Limnocylindrales bacterium]|nr:signal peptidase II [Candidatus Limnocylindrales bacterium]